jgi:hypothetical protein
MKPITDITIGIDLGDRKHAVCVLDGKGNVLKHETITNTRGSLTALSRRRRAASPEPGASCERYFPMKLGRTDSGTITKDAPAPDPGPSTETRM